MPIMSNIGGVWKTTSLTSVNIGGVWKPVAMGWVNILL